jgi:hypothetical protein
MTQVCLQRPRIVAPVCKCVPARMAQHVRVRLDRKFGPGGGSIDHAREASGGEWVPRSDVNTKGDFGS